MGGGLTFLSKKSFNPANWSNQRRVWEAQQNSETEKRRIVEREAQIKREQEEEELARVVGGEEEGGRKALGFMYDGGKIPGLKKEVDGNNKDDDNNNEHESKRVNSGGDDNESNLFQRQPGDDDAAAAFRAMLAQGVAADDTDKQLDETNQHDDVTDAQTTEDAEDDSNKHEAKDNRTKLEKAVGRGINSGSGVTLAQQMERFPMLKGAPMVLQKQKNTGGDGEKNEQAATATGMNFKPLGAVLRNVQCMACKQWGHTRGERECELSGWDPFRMSAPSAAATTTVTTTATARADPDNMADKFTSAPTTLQPDLDKMEEKPARQKSERKHKKRRKGDRHERKKKSKKHKRRRRERSPSYSSDSYSSSYDSYSSDEERHKKRRRDYSSDDSDSRRRSRKGRRKKSSRK